MFALHYSVTTCSNKRSPAARVKTFFEWRPHAVSAGTLASPSAAVANGYGSGDLGEMPKFLREAMLQNFERRGTGEWCSTRSLGE